MKARPPPPPALSLRGLRAAPSQVFGNVRLTPLLRDEVRDDLRLASRTYEDPFTIVDLGERRAYLTTYAPHALVVGWTDDGSPVGSFGTTLAGGADGKRLTGQIPGVKLLDRMAKREEGNRLRLLPQHLAFEGFLSLHFKAPEIAWTEYSREAISHGLSPRSEITVGGRGVPALEDALRVFEIHEGQCGVLLFIGDALASAFIVSHPDDYRDLHRTLLEDSFAIDLIQAAQWSGPSPVLTTPIDPARVASLDDLRQQLARVRRDLATFHADHAGTLIGRPVSTDVVYKAGPFQLQRFLTELDPAQENHIGELILSRDQTVQYARTYRLSGAQTRRAYLLKQLAAHGWNLESTAASLRTTRDELIVRLHRAGFGYLLAEHVLKAAQKRTR
ncbi:Hypothetical protein CAP_5505 [Chondromyces apiculatus DSM 436]|uniref:ARG and Rhodanese-Phosphatase-superfamily-associated domain-containing protein n=1 Tax=Chondromyces apiculatus DSM 436 TaxID=1192034 RepID=A0A017T4N4_9BACT|nr:Hypothetical protein CAP_5505 [Chondromyces apiculatus DSM 436]